VIPDTSFLLFTASFVSVIVQEPHCNLYEKSTYSFNLTVKGTAMSIGTGFVRITFKKKEETLSV
jgi:hypothetical protein